MRVALAVAATIALFVFASRAFAAAPTATERSSLSWVRLPGTEKCPGSLELARAVETRVGRPVFVPPSDAALAVEGRVEKRGAGFLATVVLSSTTGAALGTRSVEAKEPECRDLLEPLALILALMIDPSATPSNAAPVPERKEILIPVSLERPDEVPETRWMIAVDAGGSLALGMLPGAAPFAQLSAAGGVTDSFSVRIGGAFGASQVELTNTSGADLSLALGQLAGCKELAVRAQLDVALCVGGALGALNVTPYGLASAVDSESLWLAIEGLASITYRPIPPLAVRAGISLGVPLFRDRFEHGVSPEERELFRASAFIGQLSLGVGIRLD